MHAANIALAPLLATSPGPEHEENGAFHEWMRQFAFFRLLAWEECVEVARLAHKRELPRRTLICSEGMTGHYVLLLLSGCAKISKLDAAGSEVLLHVSCPGELIGALETCVGPENLVSAVTIQPTTALVWKKSDFEMVLDRHPQLRRNAAWLLAQRLQIMVERFRALSTQWVASRVGQELIRLTNQLYRPGCGVERRIYLSREEIAQLTGTTLCSVSRLLAQWEKSGLLGSRRGVVVVRNLEALKEISAISKAGK